MNAIQTLLTEHFDIWTAADTEKKSGRGRASSNAGSVYGIRKLRELVLELAVRGKLVPQDPNDESAGELLKRILAEKAKLIAEGKIKKDKPLERISEVEKPFDLPNSWVWTRLGEITNFGVTEKLDSISDEMWVLDLEDIEKDTSKLLQKIRFSERRSLSDKNSFQAGDILYGKLRPYLNKVVVADEVGVCTTEILPIRCYGSFDSHYFKVALKSPCFVNYVNARSYGMKMPRLGTEDGRKACFPLPPLAEQHRIVGKIDELMALCDQLETQHNNATEAHEKLVSHLLATLTQSQSAEDFSANWQRIAAHFDTLFITEASIDALKQTMLQLAVMGKLVPQDPKDEPASALLKRIQLEKAKLIAEGKIKKDKLLPSISDEEKPFALPTGWKWVRLSEITSIRGGSTPSMAKSEYWGGNIPWVSPKDMHDGIIVDSELKITDKALKESNLELVPIGSILIVGRSGILKRKLPAQITAVPCTVNQDIKAVTPIKPLSDRYMQLIFWGNEKEILARDVKQGTTVQSLVYDNLFSRPFSLPPGAEQNRIIAKVDEMMELCDQLKSHITEANQLQQKLADVLVEQAIT